jgi:hypothetical protein
VLATIVARSSEVGVGPPGGEKTGCPGCGNWQPASAARKTRKRRRWAIFFTAFSWAKLISDYDIASV